VVLLDLDADWFLLSIRLPHVVTMLTLLSFFPGLQECTTCITNYSCDRVESLSSLTSRDSKVNLTASMKSRSSTTSYSSGSSRGQGQFSRGQGHLLQTSKSVDMEVMKIQDKLVFSANVPVSDNFWCVFFSILLHKKTKLIFWLPREQFYHNNLFTKLMVKCCIMTVNKIFNFIL